MRNRTNPVNCSKTAQSQYRLRTRNLHEASRWTDYESAQHPFRSRDRQTHPFWTSTKDIWLSSTKRVKSNCKPPGNTRYSNSTIRWQNGLDSQCPISSKFSKSNPRCFTWGFMAISTQKHNRFPYPLTISLHYALYCRRVAPS